LKNNKLVRFRREGKVVYYSLSDEHVRLIIEKGMEHVEE
jgi:ArsR family transcriptional regulator